MKFRDPNQKLLSKQVVLNDSHTWLKGLNDFVPELRTFLRDLDEILHKESAHSDL
jgi:hypothetical protein